MIKDKFLELAALQAVTVSAATTNVINLGAAGNVIGYEPYIIVRVGTAATAAGAATLNFQIQTSVDEAFTSPIVLFDSGAIAKAALTANTNIVRVLLPLGLKQFIRGYFTVGTGPLTAGTFDVFMAETVDMK